MKRWWYGWLGLLSLALTLGPSGCQTQTPGTPSRHVRGSARLASLFADEWRHRLRRRPIFATTLGVRDLNDQLPEVSVAAKSRDDGYNRQWLSRLDDIDPAELTTEETLHRDVFRHLLTERIAEHALRFYLIPITNRWGFHIDFPELPDRVPLKTTEDYENYTSRLAKFRHYAEQHITLLRLALKEGFSLPRVVLEGFDDTIRPHIVETPEESLLYAPFNGFPSTVPEAARARLIKNGKVAIRDSVVPGYQSFLDFMLEEYIPGARATIGASALPGGRAFYEHCVRSYTTLDNTPEQVHEIGRREVKRIRAEMDEVIAELGFTGTFAEFVRSLRTEPRFYAKTPEALLERAAWISKRMDGELPKLFATLPRASYGIREIPDYVAPKTTTAYYSRPLADGSRAGFYYLNTYDLPSRPLYELEALTLHEAVPGHHLQIALQQELKDLPNFRRFAGFTAFVEGWALYAERLGLEVGFYEDPYSNFGRLSFEMWRALRLVVDTGIHALGWTRQQAIDLMVENSPLTLHNIRTEVDRYISWPGQALAYKAGELKIRELRAVAEKELGERFDLRLFHDVVLRQGSLPLPLLEAQVRSWFLESKYHFSH